MATQEEPDTDSVPRELGLHILRLTENSSNTSSHLIITSGVPRVTTTIPSRFQDTAVLRVTLITPSRDHCTLLCRAATSPPLSNATLGTPLSYPGTGRGQSSTRGLPPT